MDKHSPKHVFPQLRIKTLPKVELFLFLSKLQRTSMHSLFKRKASLTATIGNYTNKQQFKLQPTQSPLCRILWWQSGIEVVYMSSYTQSILLTLVPLRYQRGRFQPCQIQLVLWVPGLLALWLRETQRLNRRRRQGPHGQESCHCVPVSQVTNECLILSHPFLWLFSAGGRAPLAGGLIQVKSTYSWN